MPPRAEGVPDSGSVRIAEPCPKCSPVPVATGIPERLAEVTFESFHLKLNVGMAKALRQCGKVASGDAWCALLAGPPGLGKSHLAVGALKASKHPKPGRFTNFGELLRQVRRLCFDENGPHLAEDFVLDSWAKTRGILVLDDVGAEKATEWSTQTLYAILNARYELRLPTILTTNNPGVIDERVLSRYYEGTIPCEGEDIRRRQPAGKGRSQ